MSASVADPTRAIRDALVQLFLSNPEQAEATMQATLCLNLEGQTTLLTAQVQALQRIADALERLAETPAQPGRAESSDPEWPRCAVCGVELIRGVSGFDMCSGCRVRG